MISGYVFDIKKYAIHDGPGIRTTVFFKGCSLQCRWCHNPESWQLQPETSFRRSRCLGCGHCVQACGHDAISLVDGSSLTDARRCVLCGECLPECPVGAREIIGKSMTIPYVMSEIEKDIIFYDESGGGATFSGGEPLMQEQFLLALLNQCRVRDIHTTVDTTCYVEPAVMEKVSKSVDLFLCDIKHTDSDKHEAYTGVSNTLIMDNIQRLARAGKDIFIRVPIIPGFNDDMANISETARFAVSLGTVRRVDVLPYNRGGVEKSTRLATTLDLMRVETPENEEIEEIADVFRGYGFQVRVGG